MVGIYRGINIPGFLRWRRISSIHSMFLLKGLFPSLASGPVLLGVWLPRHVWSKSCPKRRCFRSCRATRGARRADPRLPLWGSRKWPPSVLHHPLVQCKVSFLLVFCEGATMRTVWDGNWDPYVLLFRVILKSTLWLGKELCVWGDVSEGHICEAPGQ